VPSERPNLLLIMSDQHRGDCLDFVAQANGQRTRVQTPHLRRLAGEGVCFTRFYSESPVCVPARAVLQTGLLPHNLPNAGPAGANGVRGMYANGDILPADQPTLAACLAEAGYFTQAIGKMHFRPVRERHGFHRLWLSEEIPWTLEEDEFLQFMVAAGYGHVEEPHGIRHEMYELPQVSQLPETHHTTAWTGRQTISFLREHARERAGRGTGGQGAQPFFCWTSFQKPHPPYEPPVPWNRLYRPAMAPAPQRSEDEFGWLPGAVRARTAQGAYPDVNRLATMWSHYFSSISFIDSWIGMILDELERLGLRENTLVLYTADHGEHMGDHWLFGKSTFYEQSACIPGLVSWPGGGIGRVGGAPGEAGPLPQGQVRPQLAGLADVVPTFLDAAGVDPAPVGLRPDGVSLLPAARDGGPTRDVLIGQVGRGAQAHLTAITGEWKYIYMAGENRELLLRPRGERAELRDELGAGGTTARETAAQLRHALQERYRTDGTKEALDERSPNGFRLFPARPAPHQEAAPSGVRGQNEQYARWIQALPAGWTPPPPAPDAAIPADLPLSSDRTRYAWPPLPPVNPQLPQPLGAKSALPGRTGERTA
jgi:arylsulfatase